ncbi:MAG: hypothetical protein HC933_03830 [Pleurocapsa sp. SU_196_0]|nr:hypothetical protein [Pleurocapsa sp. SU_196_0]
MNIVHPLERNALALALDCDTVPRLVQLSEEDYPRTQPGSNLENAMLEILKPCEVIPT